MDFGVIIAIGIVVVVIVAFFIYYFGFSTTNATHSLTYKGKNVYTSNATIANTSDGVESIYYATPTGIYVYDTSAGTTSLYSSLAATGLAYANGLLAVDANGNFYNFAVSATAPVETGISNLYSTEGGFAFTQGGQVLYNGGKTPANGSYGTLQYKVL